MERPASVIAESHPELARETHHRANETPQIDPRAHDPNPNPPIGSVGPNVPAGYGDTHAMYAAGGYHAEAWQGWPTGWGTPWLEDGTEAWSGFGFGRHNPDGYAQRVSTVMTCVDLNSSQLASFPLYGVDGRRTVPLPPWAENPQPERYADWSDFAMEVANSLYLSGEAFVWATARDAFGYPARFVCLRSRDMSVEPDGDGGVSYYLGTELLDTADVCHIRYQVLPGRLHGIGPLEWLGRNLTSASALETYARDIATHGVWAVLKHPANLDAHQADDLKRRWMSSRAASPASPAVLSGGVEFETLQLSPTDMALLDLRTFDEQHIAAAFRTPPFLVGLPQPGGSMTYTNVHQLTDHHWRVGLRPMAKKFATALSAWALPGSQRMEFDRDEYVRPGFSDRVNAWATLHGIVDETGRAISVDEIRVAERLEPYSNDPRPSADSKIGDNP